MNPLPSPPTPPCLHIKCFLSSSKHSLPSPSHFLSLSLYLSVSPSCSLTPIHSLSHLLYRFILYDILLISYLFIHSPFSLPTYFIHSPYLLLYFNRLPLTPSPFLSPTSIHQSIHQHPFIYFSPTISKASYLLLSLLIQSPSITFHSTYVLFYLLLIILLMSMCPYVFPILFMSSL